jgi:hypothetical protein
MSNASYLTSSLNPDPGLVRGSSRSDRGWKGFSDEEATQCRADRGLDPKMVKQLQELQKKNSWLKKPVAEQALEMLILEEASPRHGSDRAHEVLTGPWPDSQLERARAVPWRPGNLSGDNRLFCP